MNVDTIFVLSDPLKVWRTYQVMKPYLDENAIQKRSKRFGALLSEAKSKSSEPLEKYVAYAKLIIENFDKFKKKQNIFLNGVSPDLTDIGRPGRSGCDPASHFYGLSEDIIGTILSLPPKVQRYCAEKIVFHPISPIDFPFYVDGPVLRHCLEGEVAKLSDKLFILGKIGFGSLTKMWRDLEDKVGNYEFKEHLFDYAKLMGEMKDNPSMYCFEREFFESKGIDFEKHLSNCVQFNRWLLAEKAKFFVRSLGLKEILIYSIKTSYAYEIFERVSKELSIPLVSILRPAKEIKPLRERDSTYLGQLQGWILASYARDEGEVAKPAFFIRQKWEPDEIRFVSCPEYPFFRCEAGDGCDGSAGKACTASYITQFIPAGDVALLADDARRYNYALVAGEADIYLRNVREFWQASGHALASCWKESKVRCGPRKIAPMPFAAAHAESYDLRASEFGIKCTLSRIWNKIDKSAFPVHLDERLAKIGITAHQIKGQQPPSWKNFLHNKLLEVLGLPPTPRWEYREKEVVYTFDGIKIVGHPDCVLAYQEEGKPKEQWDIGIDDIKRGMFTRYERLGYFDQALVYGLAVVQMLNLRPARIYLTLIKTPYDPRRHFGETFDSKLLEEAYRLERYSMEKVELKSKRIEDLQNEIKRTYKKQKEILSSKKAAFAEKRTAAELGLCGNCFDKPLCDHIFKELEVKSYLEEVLPKPYPAKIHRSELFKS